MGTTTDSGAPDPAGPAVRPHLLFLGHGAERTGPPILLGHLIQGLRAHGRYEVSVLTARSGPLLDVYRSAGAHATSIGSAREPLEVVSAGLRRAGAGAVVPRLHRYLRRRAARRLPPFDLVYVNAATPATAALLRAVHPAGTAPVVLHVHELDVGLRLTLDDIDRSYLFERADHFIAVSEAVAALLVDGHGIEPDRVTTCAAFVDPAALRPLPRADARRELALPADAHVVGSVGLPDWRKDPERLLHAAHTMRRDHALDPWVVWIGGDPASTDGRHLADEARRLGLDHRFVHVAHREDPGRLLTALDVFVLPAREDAMPLAALEAASVGLPLVCFRTGGIAALCDRGAGVAVDYPDVVSLARATARLLADTDQRTATGARAATLVAAEHSVHAGTARIRSVIDHVLDRAGGRGGAPSPSGRDA